MKFCKLFFVFIILLGCKHSEPKFTRKTVDNGDIIIRWFYYSYITSLSPDIITVQKGDSIMEVLKAKRLVLDIRINSKKIIIKTCSFSDGTIVSSNTSQGVFGYKTEFDTSGTYEDLNFIPDGNK